MEEQQRTNGSSGVAHNEDVLDEDETPLIIDEGGLPSEDKYDKYKFERKNRFSKARKDVQEMANIYPCPDCGKIFRRKAKLEAHFLTHKSKDELECENCKRKFRKVELLFDHVCSSFGNNYKCSECEGSFKLKRDLVIHQRSHKLSSSDEPPDEKNPAEELDFSSFVESFVKWPVNCKQCGAELVDLQHYTAHMAGHKKGGHSYFCLMCKTKFSYKDDYLLHKDLCHIEGVFECSFCCKRFHTEKRLSDHLESHSGEGVGCDICGLRFVNKEKLSSHMKVHSTSIFVCGKCKKIFKCSSSFKNHNCAPESSEKKLYTFDDSTEKMTNEQCQDSLSTIEDSDSEDAELCEILNESHPCKVCGESFQQREDFISHLSTHFQCLECKKYFKSQSDLDMHKILLGNEKLYSCCLCEAVVHGKKELEGHISSHLTAEDDLLDDIEWEDNNEVSQYITLCSDANEPFHLKHERSLSHVKIHKVTPAGRNGLKCLSCGKLVFSEHNLSVNPESNTLIGDSDEEYVYISKLGSPHIRLKQTEETYCSCHLSSGTVLAALNEQGTSQSVSSSECGDQETPKASTTTQIPTHLHSLKDMSNESLDTKSKSFLTKTTKASSAVSSVKENATDKSDETSVSEREDCKVLINSINSIQLLEKCLSSSSASSITTSSAKRDFSNLSDNSKTSVTNVNLDGKKEVRPVQKLGIRVIKLDSSKVDSASTKSNTKELVNTNAGKNNLPAPVKIFVTTSGFLSVAANNEAKKLGTVSESAANQNSTKSSPVINKISFRKILPKVNIVSPEGSVLSPSQRNGSDKDSLNNTPSTPKKIKIEAPMRRLSPSKFRDSKKVEVIVSSKLNTNVVKTSGSEKITFENKSLNTASEKNMKAFQQSLHNSGSITQMVISNPVKKSKPFDKADSAMFARNNTSTIPSSKRTHIKKLEHKVKNKVRHDTSSFSSNGSDSYLPPEDMIFKVEKVSSDSEEGDEDDSLDFSGIKKEFLASDVFIKEEWDIVDF